MRKRIAVLVAQIDEATQKRFLTEFVRQAYAYDYDVCIFTMYQKYQETPLRDIGDSNIFELVNYALFDAVIVLSDTILTPGLAMPLQERIKKNFNGPVLIVDQESPIFDSVMIDHYTPVRKIVDHLIEVHGYKKIAYLSGKKGHPHSIQRLNGFLDSMNSHGLTVQTGWIYHGNYWYDSGEDFAEFLLQDREHMPEAIACASDTMAIGLATRFEENGIRIPEDVAVVGYDSIEAGRYSPKPLTSADIPAGECGAYCMKWLDAAIKGEEEPVFEVKAPLFIGGSCGCEYEIEMVPKKLRGEWRTQQSSRSMFSDLDHILEDLLAQSSLKDFLQVVSDYIFQIKPFTEFDICLNAGFLKPDAFVGERAIRKGYSKMVCQVFHCDGEEAQGGSIDFRRGFAVEKLLPRLHEEREYPTTYIFNPLYFDDRCFGYSVLNYGREVKVYDESYRVWMRTLLQGMEAFYRQGYMFSLVDRIKADQVRDTMTGLFNYEGFVKDADRIATTQDRYGKQIAVMTVDIKGIKQINEIYGRAAGERAIHSMSRFIVHSLNEEEICCRMCNDEFLIAIITDDDPHRADEIKEAIRGKLESFRLVEGSEFRMQFHCESLLGEPVHLGELEALINQVISIKNHKKNSVALKPKQETKDLVDEIKRNQLVTHILNKNLLTYYYQPIVNAFDGSIYAFEALMRYEEEKISPPQIIEAATYLKRLQDIERITRLNVTADVESRLEQFGDAKVFINSLPGVELAEEDDDEFSMRLYKCKGRFVIEFTEEAELDDKQLVDLKNKYKALGNHIAVDDYGAGYSNVNNLLRYMPEYVKIDRMLITELQYNPQKRHFVRNIVEFAHNNEIVALAEGVETREELEECIHLGVDLIQGFYTGRPQRDPVREIDPKIRMEIEQFRMESVGWKANT